MPKPSSASISPARLAAFDVLLNVETGAYASDDLRLRAAPLTARDAGLAAQIVFGALRFQNQLDHLIATYSGRTASDLDAELKIALRAAIFQIRYLDRVPAHAAVHNSVEFVKQRLRAATGLANATLRKVSRDPLIWPNRALACSCPEWLLRRWQYSFGEAPALAIAQAALQEPAHYIRIPAHHQPPPDPAFTPTQVPGCYRFHGAPPPFLRQQDIGSQSIVPLLALQPGHTFLDVCAAPGNKTSQALETSLALAIACDISPERLKEVPAQCPRIVLDAAQSLPFSQKFARILVDAPCTGTGTLSANPEIKWRIKPADFARFHEKQLAILCQSLRALAPAGKLVYATCSLEHEENEDVVKAALALLPAFHCDEQSYRLPGREEGDGFYAAVISARA